MKEAKKVIKIGKIINLKKDLKLDIEKCEKVIQDENESELRKRRFKQIKTEKELLVEALDCYKEKVKNEIKENK